jgi:hypothetical protein
MNAAFPLVEAFSSAFAVLRRVRPAARKKRSQRLEFFLRLGIIPRWIRKIGTRNICAVRRCSLSPGERVRVRASFRTQNKISFTTVLTPALSSEERGKRSPLSVVLKRTVITC